MGNDTAQVLEPAASADMVRSAQDAPDGGLQYVSSLALSPDKTGELVLSSQK